MCRQGASVIQSEVLDTIVDESLRAYVAWVPVLPDDAPGPDESNLAIVSDARAAHYWDAQRALPPLFAPLLGLPAGWPAWDVYLAYAAGARWRDGTPAPALWHHQLGNEPAAPVLDGATFARGVLELLVAKHR